MKYEVILTPRAKLQLYNAVLWWAKNRSAEQAAIWLAAFEAALAELADDPNRYAAARENHLFSFTLRQLSFGLGKKPTHRALFKVRGNKVYVLAVRHVSQKDVTPKDL